MAVPCCSRATSANNSIGFIVTEPPDLPSLSTLDLFAGVAMEGRRAIGASARVERVVKDALIFEQGDEADRVYAVTQGSIRIVQTGSDGGQAIIRFIAQGDMFGVVPLFTNHLAPADAIAAQPSQVISWSEADLLDLINLYPCIAVNIIRIIGSRLAEAQDRVREMATQRAEQRIAHTILRLISQAGHSADGWAAIDIPLRRKDIAEASGTTLHTASRTIAAWQKSGVLESHEQQLRIIDIPALERIAGDVDH